MINRWPIGDPPPAGGAGPPCEECGLGTWVELGGADAADIYRPNIDCRPGPTVDIVQDLEDGLPLHDSHAERIKAIHAINHLSVRGARRLLRDCWRVLRPGGELFIMVTDLEFVMERIREEGWVDSWAFCVYGSQDYDSDFHKSGYDYAHLEEELLAAGFSRVTHRGWMNKWDLKVSAVK